jgi:hypothetical protein
MQSEGWNAQEEFEKVAAAIADGSIEKSKWSATLSNGKVINYKQIAGEGIVDDDGLDVYLNWQWTDLGGEEGYVYKPDPEETVIPWSYHGRYPKDINDPVSVMLAINHLYNEYQPIKYSGNFPDISRFTSGLPDGVVESEKPSDDDVL